jgi:transient receptor potential cation channel subfamily M member 2
MLSLSDNLFIKNKYIRLYHETDMKKIDSIFKIWGLDLPNLLISVTGGAQLKMNTNLKNVFCNGLVKAAYSTSYFFVCYLIKSI